MITLILAVPINPEPWAIGPVGVTNKGGRPRGFVGQNQQLRNYQEAVKLDIKNQILGTETSRHLPTFCPVRLHLFFYRRLDSYELQTGRKGSRNAVDATNMQKAFEDALQGVLFANDRNNIQVCSVIAEQGPEVSPGTIMVMQWAENLEPDMSLLNGVVIAAAKAKFAEADKFVFNNEV